MKNLKLYLISFSLVVTSIFVLTSCNKESTQHNTEKNSPQKLQTIRIAQYGKEKFLLYLPLYLAIEEGYFKDEGLNTELIFAGNDDQVFATVAGGSADIGIGDPIFSAIAQEKGYPAKTIGTIIRKLAVTGYTDNHEINFIKNPSDLKGLKIGSFPKPSTTYTLIDKIIKDNALAETGTAIIEGGLMSQLGLLKAKTIDIAIDLEPTVSKLESEGYKVVMSLPELSAPQAITGIMTKQSTINDNKDILQKAVNAFQRSLTTISTNPKLSKSAACKIFQSTNCEIIEKALDRVLNDKVYPGSIVVNSEDWQRSLAVRLESKELKAPQATEVAVDNSFGERAK